MVEVSDERFEELVSEGFDQIPEEFLKKLTNTAVIIDDWHPDSSTTLGLYRGVALTERTSEFSGMPSTITIYREALKRYCSTEEELIEQVAITVGHEIGHHFGLDDEELHRLGW